MKRNIIFRFKVKYHNHNSDIDYEIEKEQGHFVLHRSNKRSNISKIQTISEISILHALDQSDDINDLISEIKLPSF